MALTTYTKHEILGQPRKMVQHVIPTEADVLKHLLHVKLEQKEQCKQNSYEAYKCITAKFMVIWQKFSFPTVGQVGVRKRIKCLDKKVNILMKNWKNKSESQKEVVKKDFDSTMDISPCRCYNKRIHRKDCTCAIKIPMREWDAYVQQTKRVGMLGTIDRDETRKLVQKSE